MSLSAQILVAMLLGLGTGLFFGELVEPIKIVGDAFILLLQMTVLPYVSVSLIAGLGSLRAEGAATLALRAGTAMLALWSLAFVTILTIPLAFPDWESASFFSHNLVETARGFDFLGLFIPSNPFYSLSASIVPSVVVFSAALGIALIGMEGKDGLIRALDTLKEALSRITTFVVRLAPIGVFAIATHAAGTLSLTQAASLQVYMAVYAAAALVLALWAVPGLVSAVTPYSWWDVIGRMRGVLITAFATGNLFVVLSVLTERIKELVRERGKDPERAENFVEVVVPVAFTFPSVGKLLSISFVLFAGWISGYMISPSQYPSLILAGLSSYFGATVVAIPFLLDLFQIPADTFQLFLVADNVVGLRFSTMLGAVHLVAISLLASAAMEGQILFKPIALLRYLVITLLLVVSVVLGIRFGFEAMGREYQGYSSFIGMQPTQQDRWPRILEALPEPATAAELEMSGLRRVLTRGTLRVGFQPDRLPWAFRNEDGRLVGFDVEMAHVLSQELGVDLEFVRLELDEIFAALASGAIDVGMAGIALTTRNLEYASFSSSYMDETIAFVVRDHDREKFGSRESVRHLVSPVIAVPDSPYYVEKLRRYLPSAEVVVVESPRDFFRAEKGTFDALLYTAESGSAWSLVYPEFTVAVPQPDILKVPLAYPVRKRDERMVELLSAWIELKRRDRTIDELYEYWILGRASAKRERRWSVLADVLGWVEGGGQGSGADEEPDWGAEPESADEAAPAPEAEAEPQPEPQPPSATGGVPAPVSPAEPHTSDALGIGDPPPAPAPPVREATP